MLILAFFQWWYGPGWSDAAHRVRSRLRQIYLNFSVPILIKTLFAPWRRIITAPGSSLQQKLRAILDNAISRAVGFTMRLIMLLTAIVLLVSCSLIGELFILIWPIVPALGPILLVGGLIL